MKGARGPSRPCPPGRYRVSVTKAGFKAELKTAVAIESGVPATVNVKLEVGQAAETVVVQGGAEVVQTTNAELSSTITGRQINELPVERGRPEPRGSGFFLYALTMKIVRAASLNPTRSPLQLFPAIDE